MSAPFCEYVTDGLKFLQVWECDPPPRGTLYRVLDDEWTDDFKRRVIRRVTVLEGPPLTPDTEVR